MNRLRCLVLLFGTLNISAQSIVWNNPCTDKNFCLNAGSCTEGGVYMVEKATTNCPNQLLSYSFKIDLTNNGSYDINSSEDTITGIFQKGTHKVTWRATDQCGNVGQCTYLFTIKDCAGPNLICINGLTQNLDPPGCAEIFYANQFVNSLSDNCTPAGQIDIGIREVGTGSGFPADTFVAFDSCDTGLRFIEVWARDGGGLTTSCQGYVLVQNAGNGCSCNIDADLTFTGCARTAGNLKMTNYTPKAQIERLDSLGSWIKQSNVSDSCFSLAAGGIPFGGNYRATVRALRTDNPLNGFSTFDLALISKHILGIEPFTSFYQVMAADMNKSHTVTTFDIVEGRKLLLGIYDTLPNLPSWRLIRPLANPGNMNQWDIVRDTYQFTYNNLFGDFNIPNLHFVGVKSGDINMSANFNAPPEDRAQRPLVLRFADRFVTAGESVSVPVFITGDVSLTAWQLAVQADPGRFRQEIPEDLAGDCFHLGDDGALRAVWFAATPENLADGTVLFTLRLQALQSGWLSAGLSAGTSTPAAFAYEGSGRSLPIVLQAVEGHANAAGGPQCFPPAPNPFTESTGFGFWLPAESEIRLEIFEPGGRLVYRNGMMSAAGYSTFILPAADLPSGWLVYRIQAGARVFTGKVMKGQ